MGGYGDFIEGVFVIMNIVECYDLFINRYLRYCYILLLVKVKECLMYWYFSFKIFMILCIVFIVFCNCFVDGCKEVVCVLVVVMLVLFVLGIFCILVEVWL